ncbi:hypothetical protein L0337_07065 [candidate division KSB1 bacterium]|nr:hypothetical protein [candidate division KSB1 bacterium]
MKLKAYKTNLQTILPLRNLFLHETNFQIRYNACHERGWTDSYLLTSDDIEIGYGSIKGQEIADRDTIFEFYLIQYAVCRFVYGSQREFPQKRTGKLYLAGIEEGVLSFRSGAGSALQCPE